MLKLSISIRPCTDQDEKFIREKVGEFRLDDAEMEMGQFLVAELNEQLVGFGRLREFENSCEMCTLGVIENERLKGIGSALANALSQKAKKPLYLVCIIPEFFTPLGFEMCVNYPSHMAEKLHRCETQLSVPEKYVVMKKRVEE